VTKLPVVKDYVARTVSVAVVDLHHEGGSLRGDGPVCSVNIRGSSSMVRTEIPDAFVRSLPKTRIDASLVPTQNGFEFSQGSQSLVVGAKLKDPSREPLPQNASDRRVYDQDHDGNPGVTVNVHGIVSGKVFVAQRSTSSLSGRQTNTGFAGAVRFRVEQTVLGATSAFLQGNPGGTPNFKGSSFRLEKLPNGSDCRAATAAAQRLSAPPP
jgi:hypothetical protein